MNEPAAASGLPTRLLADPEMVTACAKRDFAKVFAMAKARGGFHASRIARVCDLTPSRVGEVLSGRRVITNMNVIERIADGLCIPGHMLGLAPRSWERPSPPAPPLASPGIGQNSEAFPALPIADDLDGILALAAGARVTPGTLRALRTSIEDYWRRDDEHGGEALRPAVIGQFRYAVRLLTDAKDPDHRRALHEIAAELARLVGWTCFDARRYSTARTYFTESLRLARAVDDRPFIANVLACLSLQATYEDRADEAVTLARAAQDISRPDGLPRLMAMLSLREAFGHASTRDASATHAAIDEAHGHFARALPTDPDPPWIAYFDQAKLTVDTGIALGHLGEAHTAAPLISEALREEPTTNLRGRAFHTLWLARTQLASGQVETACHTAGQALDLSATIDSPRVDGHLQEFRRLLAPLHSVRPALELDARIREAVS